MSINPNETKIRYTGPQKPPTSSDGSLERTPNKDTFTPSNVIVRYAGPQMPQQ